MGAVIKQFPDRRERFWRPLRGAFDKALADRGVPAADRLQIVADLSSRLERCTCKFPDDLQNDEGALAIWHEAVGATFALIIELASELYFASRPKP